MTDTGQFPERGQLDQAGGQPGQLDPPPVPVPVAFPFPDVADADADADDREDEDLLMPGSHSPWSEPTPHRGTPAAGTPVSGTPAGGTPAGRRAPHLGPPMPEPPGVVRPLAARPGAPQPAQQGSPPTGPEYLDLATEALAPAESAEPAAQPHPGHGVLPAQPGAWQPLPAGAPETAGPAVLGQETGIPPAMAQTPAGGHPMPAADIPAAPAALTVAETAAQTQDQPQPAPGPGVPVAGYPAYPAAEQSPSDVVAAGPPVAETVVPEVAVAPDTVVPDTVVPEAAAPDTAVPEAAAPDTAVPGAVAAEPQPEPPAAAVEPAPHAGPIIVPAPREESGSAVPEPVAATAYDETERDAVHRLMRDRRDTRQGFRPDPIPHEVLLRVLEAAHTAPTVGQSQPWDFVIIRSPETRRTVHDLAVRQRESYAKTLSRAQAKQLQEPVAEAILQTPVNIVVTADPTRGGRAALSQGARPEAAPYSTARAVENLWLAARAEGLGVDWVGFLDERELVEPLGLPAHLDIVAYLCVGYAAEPAAEPVADTDPAARRPLSWVVHEESYGRRALPGSEPHDLLGETLGQIRPLDAQALGEAWERQRRMAKPAGALGALEVIAAQLCGLTRSCPPPIPEPAAVAVFAGDHGVHAQGVTSWPQEATGQMVANFLGGGAVCNAFAAQVGAEVCVIDVGVRGELPAAPGLMPRKVRHGTADFTVGPALTRPEVLRALEIGIETARDLVAAGNRALLTGEMGVANTTVSAALTAVFTGADPAEVTGRGSGIDDETYARKAAVVRTALELHQPDPADPIAVLEAVGGLEHAALAGLILGGASLRVPVVLDGVTAGAAALVARAIAPESVSACIAGHRSAEPAHLAALTALGLRPLVDLDLRLGEGTGALLALPVVQAAARALREVATFDSAGISGSS